jgi:hypothetical protein
LNSNETTRREALQRHFELTRQDGELKELILQLQQDSIRKEKEIEGVISSQLQNFSRQENQRYSEMLQRQHLEQQKFELLLEGHQHKLQQEAVQEKQKDDIQTELRYILKKLEKLETQQIVEPPESRADRGTPQKSTPDRFQTSSIIQSPVTPPKPITSIESTRNILPEAEVQTYKRLAIPESPVLVPNKPATASENLQTLNDIELELEQLKNMLNSLQSTKSKNPFASLPATPKEKQYRDLDVSPEPFPIQKHKPSYLTEDRIPKPYLQDRSKGGSDTSFFMDTYYRSKPSLRNKMSLTPPFDPANKPLGPRFSFIFKKP